MLTSWHILSLFCFVFFQRNTFEYTVIGGCHRLKAVKDLDKMGHKGLDTVEVQVYGAELFNNRKALCWWAHQHNELQSMQLNLKTQDKVTVCIFSFLFQR